jgi:heptosyltransferase-2
MDYSPTMTPQRILICRGGALGDLLLTFPLLAAVREHWRAAAITLAAYPPHSRLALAGGLADSLVSLDSAGAAEWFTPGPDLPAATAQFLGSFDLVLSFLHDPDGGFVLKLRRAGVRGTVTCSPLVRHGHAIDHFLAVTGKLGIPVPDRPCARLTLPSAADRDGAAHVRSLGGEVVVLHPGSGSPRKNWPMAGFAALARLIARETKARPVFLLGEAEAALGEPLGQLCPGVPFLRSIELVTLAGVLKHCRAYVGNDSGVTHLAAATGVPVLAIFGATAPGMWAPRGTNVHVADGRTATPESLSGTVAGLLGRRAPSHERREGTRRG